MAHGQVATPCPTAQSSSSLPLPVGGRRQRDVLATYQDDTLTVDIDYTRAVQPRLTGPPPRRRSTFHRRAESQPAITIFEDVLEEHELVIEPTREAQANSLLGRPAQRLPSRKAYVREGTDVVDEPSLKQPGRARARASLMPRAEAIAVKDPTDAPHQNSGSLQSVLKKNPRRRTIFVPSEDTTILTIHPGANTTNPLNDTFQLPGIPPAVAQSAFPISTQQQAAPTKQERRPRLSLAAAPKRVPLRQSMIWTNIPAEDIPGQNGGKENVPPGSRTEIIDKDRPCKPYASTNSKHFGPQCSATISRLIESTAASQAKQSNIGPARRSIEFARPQIGGREQRLNPCGSSVRRPSMSKGKVHRPSSTARREDPTAIAASMHVSHAARLIPRRQSPPNRLKNYPVLLEDLAQPELYEDKWLTQQEVSLTEIVNQIFANAGDVHLRAHVSDQPLRQRMISIYHQPQVATLHKRLQASLLCGALSRPKELVDFPNPASDIGLRKRFLSFWLNSYDEEALRTAAEVVVGRQVPSKLATPLTTSEDVLDPLRQRRALTLFLETFLVDCYDVERRDSCAATNNDFESQRWQKMAIRSLMLIWLLDQARTSKVIDRCLFLQSSPRKTSETTIHSLARMIIPAIGDIIRSLRYLDYEVSHCQTPLDEVKYCIKNIAVDLRDGVFLTRLVELLLFSERHNQDQSSDDNATVTIQLPDSVILESMRRRLDGTQCPQVVSQHLKLPCLSRVQKLYNVQLALSALQDHGQLKVEAGIEWTAQDIVDGHREKTLSLIWSLVGSYGLDRLVDWKSLIVDIRRACAEGRVVIEEALIPDDQNMLGLSQKQQERLLKSWAALHCAHFGLRIANLTTSFADGKAYSAIVQSFARYLRPGNGISGAMGLEQQLHSLGCSTVFAEQLVSGTHTIPSRRTTISTLAFLASRLLPLARQYNAAVTIQQAVRIVHQRKLVRQRIVLMRLAHACATVVQTQNRLVHAATVLQRAWRRVVDFRIQSWNRDVTAFQALARRWKLRANMNETRQERYFWSGV